jgi:hypothetical protein
VAETQPHQEETFLDEEAAADSAPVVADLTYKARVAWKPGRCAGSIVNWSNPVARLKWPKWREAKEFLARIAKVI